MSDQEVVATAEPIADETEVEEAVEATESASSNDGVVTENVAPVTPEPAAAEETTDGDVDGSSIHSLSTGQNLTGKVKNITEFGAFVDVGLAQDGLVHISELARKKVEKVTDVVSEGDEVDVWVKKIDTKRGRISLTMIKPIDLRIKDIEEEAELQGTITRLESYGAFIDIGSERDGLVHISQITHDYIKHPQDTLTVGDSVTVKVIKVNRKKRQVDLSIKALIPAPVVEKVVVEKPKRQNKSKKFEMPKEIEQEPVPTAMALAYAAMQNQSDDDNSTDTDQSGGKSKRKHEMNDIVARTLAAAE